MFILVFFSTFVPTRARHFFGLQARLSTFACHVMEEQHGFRPSNRIDEYLLTANAFLDKTFAIGVWRCVGHGVVCKKVYWSITCGWCYPTHGMGEGFVTVLDLAHLMDATLQKRGVTPNQWGPMAVDFFFPLRDIHDLVLKFRFVHCKIYLPHVSWRGGCAETASNISFPRMPGTGKVLQVRSVRHGESVAKNSVPRDGMFSSFLDLCSM